MSKTIQDLIKKLNDERRAAPVEKVMEVAHSDSYMIELMFDNEGVVRLARQKALVATVMASITGLDELEGLLNLIDVIQDDLHEAHGFKEEYVFPYNNGYSDEIDLVDYRMAMADLLKALPLEDLPKYLNRSGALDSVLKKFFKEG